MKKFFITAGALVALAVPSAAMAAAPNGEQVLKPTHAGFTSLIGYYSPTSRWRLQSSRPPALQQTARRDSPLSRQPRRPATTGGSDSLGCGSSSKPIRHEAKSVASPSRTRVDLGMS